MTLSTTHRPATDLGFLLHKNPARVQSLDVSTGRAHLFYPEATKERCTAALLLEVDPIELVRGRRPTTDGPLGQYVNDRPYAASSMLAVALAKTFSSARRGLSKERSDLAATAIPLEIHLPALACRGGADNARRFFGPMGWDVRATAIPLDEQLGWRDSRHVDLHLTGVFRVADALNHLYVALPVLDDAKHYWVSIDEVDKLLRAGEGWLTGHPDREWITARYLAHQRSYVQQAISRLADADVAADADVEDSERVSTGHTTGDRPRPLVEHRHAAVLSAIRTAGAHRILDLGAGSGALLPALLADPNAEVVAVEVSHRSLQTIARRVRDRMPERQQQRLTLLQGALTYTDDRLVGYDAAILMEVIEHLDLDRLPALEHCVFAHARPGTVIVTTPNADHNPLYDGLPAGALRHRDHRFEWSRAQFTDWAGGVADRHRYRLELLPVGPADPQLGPPTQMAVFTSTPGTPADPPAAA